MHACRRRELLAALCVCVIVCTCAVYAPVLCVQRTVTSCRRYICTSTTRDDERMTVTKGWFWVARGDAQTRLTCRKCPVDSKGSKWGNRMPLLMRMRSKLWDRRD